MHFNLYQTTGKAPAFKSHKSSNKIHEIAISHNDLAIVSTYKPQSLCCFIHPQFFAAFYLIVLTHLFFQTGGLRSPQNFLKHKPHQFALYYLSVLAGSSLYPVCYNGHSLLLNSNVSRINKIENLSAALAVTRLTSFCSALLWALYVAIF